MDRLEKCDKCGGVGSHVEGKRGFTRFPCPNATPTPPAPADDATKCHVCGRPATRHGPEPMCEDRWNGVTCALDSAIRRAHHADDASGASASEAMREAFESWWDGPKDGETMRPFGSGSKAHAWMVWQAARALPLPARPTAAADAVVEAARFAGYEVERARFDAWWAENATEGSTRAAAWDAYYARALRGANGGE